MKGSSTTLVSVGGLDDTATNRSTITTGSVYLHGSSTSSSKRQRFQPSKLLVVPLGERFDEEEEERRCRDADVMSDESLAAPLSSSATTQQQEQGRQDADVLSTFLPPAVRSTLERISGEERHFTETLEAQLKQAWEEVEAVMTRNKNRLRALQEEAPEALGDLKGVPFWSSETLRLRFGLEEQQQQQQHNGVSGGGNTTSSSFTGAGGATADDTDTLFSRMTSATGNTLSSSSLVLSKVKLKTDTTMAPGSGSGSASWASRDRQLLLEQKETQHAPLRRLFRHILEQKEQLPKELTLLLATIDQVQRNDLATIEEALQQCPLVVPVHIPLSRIATLIKRQLTPPSRGSYTEAVFLKAMKPLTIDLDRDYEHLRGLWSAEDTESKSKPDATATLWKTLLSEVSTRNDLHKEWRDVYARVVAYEAELMTNIPSALTQCAKDVESDFEAIRADAGAVESFAKDAYTKIMTAMQAAEDAYTNDRSYLDTALKGAWYSISQSHVAQEKCARRVREAIKEFHREQSKHAQLVKDYLHLQTSSFAIDASIQQLRDTLNVRLNHVSAAKDVSASLQQLLSAAEASCKVLHKACVDHVNRMEHEEHYRKCRMVTFGIDNASKRLRCVNDISSLYEARQDAVQAKSESAWQLQYLLTHERQKCTENLEAVKQELMVIDSAWQEIKQCLEDLELPIPSVDTLDQSEGTLRMRSIFKSIDEDSVVAKVACHLSDRSMIRAMTRIGLHRSQFLELQRQAVGPDGRFVFQQELKGKQLNSIAASYNTTDTAAEGETNLSGAPSTTKPSSARGGERQSVSTTGSLAPLIAPRSYAKTYHSGSGGASSSTILTPRPPHRDAHHQKVQ